MNRIKLVKGMNLGGLNLQPGSIINTTDPVDGLLAMGVAVVETEPKPEPVIVKREPKFGNRDPK